MTDRIRATLELDLRAALSEIDDLERRLDFLSQPVTVPLQITGENALSDLRSDVERGEQGLEELRREADRAEESIEDIGDEAKRSGRDLDDMGRRGGKSFSSLGAGIGAAAGALATFVSARGVFEFFSDAVQAGSDLEESLSKTRVVFGEFSGDIEAFSNTAPAALRLSEQAALEATATFGNLFTALGLSQEAAADLSPDIVQLAADLASFNNISVDDAIVALRSGLVGEVEPLRRLGVAINAATVEAKAMELGLIGANGEVTEAAKVQARYALILEQTKNAQGDAAETADTWAGQTRILAAEVETMSATLGQALIPALLDAIPATKDWAVALTALAIQVAETIGVLDDDVAALTTWSLQSGFAADSAELLAGAIIKTGLSAGRSRGPLGLFIDETAAVAESFENLLAASEATPEALQKILFNLPFLADEARLTTTEVDALREALEEQIRFGLIDQAVTTNIESIRLGLQGVAAAAGEIPPEIPAPEVETPDFSAATEALDAFEAQIERLPGVMDAARVAFKDSEGEIQDDFTEFFAGLADEFERELQFAEGIDILRDLGLDDLADQFEALGIESLDLLLDGLTDPAELKAAEQAIDQFSRNLADTFRTTLFEEINSQDWDLPELEPQLAEDTRSNLFAELNAFDLKIPATIIPTLSQGFLEANLTVGGSGGGGTTVINNFNTTPQPTTDTNRITQTINAVRAI